MTRAHLFVLAAVLVTFLAVPRIAVAYEPPPCPADQPPPTLSVSDPKGAGSLFATHVLRAKIDGGEVRSFTAPGARIFSQDDASRPELVSDTPGPLTATAVVVIRDTERLPYQDDYSCTSGVATTVELLAPGPRSSGTSGVRATSSRHASSTAPRRPSPSRSSSRRWVLTCRHSPFARGARAASGCRAPVSGRPPTTTRCESSRSLTARSHGDANCSVRR